MFKVDHNGDDMGYVVCRVTLPRFFSIYLWTFLSFSVASQPEKMSCTPGILPLVGASPVSYVLIEVRWFGWASYIVYRRHILVAVTRLNLFSSLLGCRILGPSCSVEQRLITLHVILSHRDLLKGLVDVWCMWGLTCLCVSAWKMDSRMKDWVCISEHALTVL